MLHTQQLPVGARLDDDFGPATSAAAMYLGTTRQQQACSSMSAGEVHVCMASLLDRKCINEDTYIS
jgi:hypothetical protein